MTEAGRHLIAFHIADCHDDLGRFYFSASGARHQSSSSHRSSSTLVPVRHFSVSKSHRALAFRIQAMAHRQIAKAEAPGQGILPLSPLLPRSSKLRE
jgi:hypothetical protein